MPQMILGDLTKMTTDERVYALSDIVYGRTKDDASRTLYEIVDELESRCAVQEDILRVRSATKSQQFR